MRKRLSIKFGALAAAAALVLAGCSSTPQEPQGNGDKSINFGLSAEPTDLITGVQQSAAHNTVRTLIHRGLVAYNNKGEIINALAKEVTNPTPATYVFELREGLKFHDGTDVTAEIVKANLEYYANPESGSNLNAGLRAISSINTDGNTVTVELKQPNTAFLQYLAMPTGSIVPVEFLNSDGGNWIGAGPFKVAERTNGVSLVVDRFADYYEEISGNLEKVTFAFYPDGEARSTAVISGDVDIIDYVPWENFERVRSTSGLTLVPQNGPFQYVQFNVTDGPFADPKVRQAVAYAINRENSVVAAFQSNGAPLYGVVIPETDAAYDASRVKLWDYDPEKAKALLAEAGYPNGFEATMLSTSQYTFLQDNAISVQADLEAIGIKVKMDAPDWSTRVSKGAAGEYDLAVSGDAGIVTDPVYLLNLVSGPNGFNRSYNYENPELTKAITEGASAANDEEKKAAWAKAYDLIQNDVPFASINTREQAFAHNGKIKDFKNIPGFLTFFSGYSLLEVTVD